MHLSRRLAKTICRNGPRCLFVSSKEDAVLIGGDEGTVEHFVLSSLIEDGLFPESKVGPEPEVRTDGIRSLLPITEIDEKLPKGWLLYGTTSGNIFLWQYRNDEPPSEGNEQKVLTEPKLLEVHEGTVSSAERNPVTFIGFWDGDEISVSVLISWRLSPAKIVKFEKRQAGAPLELINKCILHPAMRAIVGVARDQSGMLCITSAGQLWRTQAREPEPQLVNVRTKWRPNIVTDFSPGPDGEGSYVATDAGILFIPPLRELTRGVELENLPGFYGPAASISRQNLKSVSQQTQNLDLLWVTDYKGSVFSFEREGEDVEREDEDRLWKLRRFHQEPSRVALSTAKTINDKSLVVVHVCRTREVIATLYSQYESELQQEADRLKPFRDHQFSKPPQGHVDDLESKPWKDWSPMARYATHVEAAVLKEAHDKEKEFLSLLLSDEKLIEPVAASLGERPILEMRHELLLCVDALSACINRRAVEDSELHTALSLALIRWLRQLQELVSNDDKNELIKIFTEAVERVRKWSLFGNVFQQQEDLRSPLRALKKQFEKHEQLYQLDHFVSRAMLFARHLSTDFKEVIASGDPAIPLDLAILRPDSKPGSNTLFLATSWDDGSVLVHRLERSLEGQSWRLRSSERTERTQESRRSRSLLLLADTSGSLETVLLLHAPAQASPGNENESLCLIRFDFLEAAEVKCEEAAPGPLALDPGESVFCLRALGGGLVFVGLAGSRGGAEFKLIRITPELQIVALENITPKAERPSVVHLTAAYPELDESEKNPIWSSALVAENAKGIGSFELVIGCGDGQILRLELEVERESFTCRPIQVGRLGTPVRALLCRETPLSGGLRVFAGGQDGTLIAFESVPGSKRGSFDSLWATSEESPIARLHLVKLRDGDEEEPVIIGGTRKGRFVLFSDVDRIKCRPGAGDVGMKGDPRLLRVPGERLGRFHLDESLFASQILPSDLQDESSTPFATFAIATGTGILRILTLHFPKYTPARHKEFKAIEDLLDEIVKKGHPGYLRLLDALAAAVPQITASTVRYLLLPGNKSGSARPYLPRDQHLVPWHLQPLLRLGRLFESLLGRSTISGQELRNNLRQALDNAHAFRDFRLFKEIVRVALQIANNLLLDRCKDEEADISWYSNLAACLADVKGFWVEDVADIDTKTRIVIIKAWVAPSAYLALSRLLSAERRRVKARAPIQSPVEKAIQSHVRLLHESFAHGDSLLSLETLRAVDQALTRAHKRLEENEEIEEHLLRRLFQAVGAFASRSVHGTQGEDGPAVALEIARLYALGLHCAPSAALSLIHRMSEADLPPEVGRKILQQFKLLERLLYPEPPLHLKNVYTILEVGFGLGPPDYFLSELKNDFDFDFGRTGSLNAEYIGEGEDFDKIQKWLRDNAALLRRDPEEVRFEGLFRIWEKSKNSSEFRHSFEFWSKALSDLFKNRLKSEFEKSSVDPGDGRNDRKEGVEELIPNQIDPDLVLQSADLVKWSEDQIERLGKMKKDYLIFDPQRQLYEEALQDFADAAKGLRSGAALQRNIVLGVLGHGLLENLGYHLLSLWEIARRIDPFSHERLANRQAKGDLAGTVLSASAKAEGVIRTLRNIQALLAKDPSEAKAPLAKKSKEIIQRPVREILGNNGAFPWFERLGPRDKAVDLNISDRVLAALHFSFRELVANESEHGMGVTGKSFATLDNDPQKTQFSLTFPVTAKKTEELAKRLTDVQASRLKGPVGPDQNSNGRSHGFGLYLSRLALASVGWDFEMTFIDFGDWRLVYKFTNKEPELED